MALKQKITAAEYDKLSDALKAEYKKSGDDYLLDIDGIDDPAELRRARDREKLARETAETNLREAQKKLDDLRVKEDDDRRKGLRNSNDFDALETLYKQQVKDAETALNLKLDKKNSFIRQRLVDDTALALAKELAGDNATILLPHIRSRLDVDTDADIPVTKVLDTAGRPTLHTVDDLSAEFLANKSFSSIILVSKGSGGGAPGGRQGGSGGSRKPFADMTGAERTEYLKADPAGFARDSAVAKAKSGIRI